MHFGLSPTLLRRLDLLRRLGKPIEPFGWLTGHPVSLCESSENKRQLRIGASRAAARDALKDQWDTLQYLAHRTDTPAADNVPKGKIQRKTLFTRDRKYLLSRLHHRL